ncbi:cycloeucalenol cycloisomerase [Ranunculus cassubicifolius]
MCQEDANAILIDQFHSDISSNTCLKETSSSSAWFSTNPSKRWGEIFFLLYTPFWLILILGIIVPLKLYESFNELEYLLVGLISAVPSFVIPLLVVGKADSNLALKDRYWVKANLWIVVFSYVGNYFGTHYFFTLLGASYTFPSWKMNNVPHTTFLLTHVCFHFYHVTSNIILRKLYQSITGLPESIQWVAKATWILCLSYFIAYLETVSISKFPYYEFVDRDAMYKVGCLFYAIYFLVSFPMFLRIDEEHCESWDLPRVAIDALGAAMLVIILLDLWRNFVGPIISLSGAKQQCLELELPWFAHPTVASP